MRIILIILLLGGTHQLLLAQGTKNIVTDFSGNVRSLKGANSFYQDFSLVVSGNEAYFASSREPSLVHYKENNWEKNGKVNVYKADVSGLEDYYEVKVNNIQQMIELKDQFTHVGPLCFSSSGDTLFFTKVPFKVKDKNINILKPQLFMLTKVGGKWNKTPQQLPFNNPLYVFAHPSYDSKTQTLYFVSDVEGGVGGKDVYSSSIKEGKWTSPANIKSVNTKFDELFPHYGEDRTLFFSSNRKESKGGLDVFYLELGSRDAKNLDFVNTVADDFGFFKVKGKNIGFLSSNRNGNDDIFAITINKQKNYKNSLFGKFKYRKLDEAIEQPLTVYLLNDMKEPVLEVFVNENGEFEFEDIGSLENYTIQAKSKAEMDLVLFDSEGNPDDKLLADEGNEFVYKAVEIKDVGELNLSQINENGETIISGRFLYEDNPTEETGVLKVNLIDPNGNTAHTISSDESGYFDFSNLPKDKDYIVKLEEENTDLTLIIFNLDGKIIEKLKDDGSGFYLFRQLKVLDINDLERKNYLREDAFSFDSGLINGDFDKGGMDVDFGQDLIISVYDENGNFIDTLRSNAKGQFVYEKMAGIENYSFQLDKMDENFDAADISLKIIDDSGNLIKEIIPQSNGDFVYRSLEILNIQALKARDKVDEGEFDFMAGTGEEVFGSVKYNNQSIDLADGVEISIYDKNNNFHSKERTNAKGEFKFTDENNMSLYNIEITDKPDSMSLDLFSINVKKDDQINELTLLPSATNKFTYRKLDLVDNNKNLAGLNKLEESLDLIFDIKGNFDYNSQEGDFDPQLKVFAYDGNGNKIGQVVADRFGNFVFEKLPGISTVLFKLESVPEDFDLENFSLFIVGEDGKQLAKLASGEKGFFVYKPQGFASEIPVEIMEQFSDNTKHATFGTSALDISNEIESIYFGSNKTSPNKSDLLKIKKTLLLLEINTSSTLEISAYADSRASDNYNLILSEKRAKWVKSYLVREGIDESRIIINAYGEGKLVNDCEDGIDCPDKFHALNRRAELRIFN
ncbi:MAG: OmpA family protein [Crocinitomicaceae bacterium]